MTRGPRRLLDDPDFKWETGCDLADERELVGTYDLEASKKRLLASIALPLAAGAPTTADGAAAGPTIGDGMPVIRTGSRWAWVSKPVIAAVAGAGAIAGAFWLGMHSASVPEGSGVRVRPAIAAPVEAPVEARIAIPEVPVAPPVAAPPVAIEIVTPVEEPPAAPAEAPRADVAPPASSVVPADAPPVIVDAVAALAAEPVAEEVPAVVGDAVVDTVEPSPPMAAPLPDRARETWLLVAAGEALRDGRGAAARGFYEQYLAEFESGDFQLEAKIGLLEALRAMNDPAAVEALAAELQDLREFAGRRDEILRLRAESLVVLSRCDEALLVSEELSARASADIRRSCRRRE